MAGNWHQAVKLWMGNWHSALDARISARGVGPWSRPRSTQRTAARVLQRKLGGGGRGSRPPRLPAQPQEESCRQLEAVRTAGLGADNSRSCRACSEPPHPGGVSAPQFHPAPPSALPASAGFPPAPAFAPTHCLPRPLGRRSPRSIPPRPGAPRKRCDPAPLRSPLPQTLPLPPLGELRASLKPPTRVLQPTRKANAPATRPHPQGPRPPVALPPPLRPPTPLARSPPTTTPA
ncbi:PREDICTED: proline-rich protein 2-like [Cercocebus atys]|uniref:proline-rich protein 2-like n=1 Tax=Cercocebus atys TaxID=9531 RepID=UPI0005F54A38|nr:PREDICTED: proline-rich protein 2-like [Cercocebus atys]